MSGAARGGTGAAAGAIAQAASSGMAARARGSFMLLRYIGSAATATAKAASEIGPAPQEVVIDAGELQHRGVRTAVRAVKRCRTPLSKSVRTFSCEPLNGVRQEET